MKKIKSKTDLQRAREDRCRRERGWKGVKEARNRNNEVKPVNARALRDVAANNQIFQDGREELVARGRRQYQRVLASATETNDWANTLVHGCQTYCSLTEPHTLDMHR